MDTKKSSKGCGKILSNESYNFLHMDPRGLGYIFMDKLAEHGKEVMQIDAITGKEETFESFRTRCVRTALHMRAKGFHPQDKITVCSFNTLDSPIPYVASILTGIIPNGIDPTFSVDDFKYYLQVVKPKAIFACSEVEHSVKKALESINLNAKIIVFGASFNDFLKPIEGEETFTPFLPLSVRDTAAILFSSGTTGKPKAICLSHIGLHQFVVAVPIFSKNDRAMFYSSLYWMSQVYLTFSNIVYGFVKLVYPKYDTPRAFCDIAKNYNMNMSLLPPSHLVEVTSYCIKNGITLSLNNMLVGGALVAKEHLKLARTVFPTTKFLNCYGQTEAGFVTYFPKKGESTEKQEKKHEEKIFAGSSGSVCPGVTIRIANLDTDESLGPREEGEIRIRSYTTMNGYYGKDSSDLYDSQGWFRTGDIGCYDEEGYIYIVGRCKEMLKYKSFPVVPAILEEIVLQHPAVKECIVTGIPHDVDGDHPVAFVTLKLGYDINPDEIRKFVDDRVDDRKKLRGGVRIIDSIPLTVTGKPKRYALKEMLTPIKAQ